MNEPFSPRPTEDSSAPDPGDQAARPGIRFGLLDLLLLLSFVAAWLPVVIAWRRIPVLETEIQTMRYQTMELIVEDQQKLNARTLPSIWHNISGWKVYTPPDADLELRLATDGINSVSDPTDYTSIPLPEGEHAIHLKVTKDDEGYHSKVYIDDELSLQKHHPPDWTETSGSSSSTGIANESAVYPIDQTLTLKDQEFSIKSPLKKYQTVDIPKEYDHKGNRLWISPKTLVPESPSVFSLLQQPNSGDAVGHREGLKASPSNIQGRIGLICLQPSLAATLGDHHRWGYLPLGISIRPVLNDASAPEIPEEQIDKIRQSTGLPISFRETLNPPTKSNEYSKREKITAEAISDDGREMRVFAHLAPFASGAKPIVEIRFDSEHPDRVGFLPHAAPGSPPMNACQFVTRFDAKFLWREIEMRSTAEEESTSLPDLITPVLLAKLYPEIDFTELQASTSPDTAPLSWHPLPLRRLPLTGPTGGEREHAKLSLLTDVSNASKLTYPAGLGREWQYEGVPNRQTWLLPLSPEDDSASAVKVEVRATAFFPGTDLPVPGGPVLGNVRITVPMPATEPIWLEIVAAPETVGE